MEKIARTQTKFQLTVSLFCVVCALVFLLLRCARAIAFVVYCFAAVFVVAFYFITLLP